MPSFPSSSFSHFVLSASGWPALSLSLSLSLFPVPLFFLRDFTRSCCPPFIFIAPWPRRYRDRGRERGKTQLRQLLKQSAANLLSPHGQFSGPSSAGPQSCGAGGTPHANYRQPFFLLTGVFSPFFLIRVVRVHPNCSTLVHILFVHCDKIVRSGCAL